jgi:hypothetical protein
VTFNVSVARRTAPRVRALRGRAQERFWEAVRQLEGEGCKAAHYRMRAPDGGDAHICGLRFYADWRMHLVFGENNNIVVAWVGQHSDKENAHIDGAEDIPQLAHIGRRRADQPPCCDEFDEPPADQDLVDLVNALRPARARTR